LERANYSSGALRATYFNTEWVDRVIGPPIHRVIAELLIADFRFSIEKRNLQLRMGK
jgi:hypothetical protein